MATYTINDYFVYNKATGELEPYPQVAAQPGFNINAEVLFDPSGNKYVGSELQAAIRANANRFDPIVYDIKFNEQTPGKSRVKLKFDDYEDYWKLFDLKDGDIWFGNYIYSNYDSYEFESADFAD